MEIRKINTYNNAPERVFETLCSQIFENWLKRQYVDIAYFSVVNGAGGDGGVEAYAARKGGEIIGLQAKWFSSSIGAKQIKQIESSVRTAKQVRPALTEYVVCISRDTHSMKKGKEGKVITDTEERKLNKLINDLEKEFQDLKVTLWKEHKLITELKHPENEGLIKLWFEKEEISIETLKIRFNTASKGWLSDRYFPDLHNQGAISEVINEILVSSTYLLEQAESIQEVIDDLKKAIALIEEYCLKNKIDEELNTELKEISVFFSKYYSVYLELKQEFINNNSFFNTSEIEEVKIYPIYTKFSQAIVPNVLRETHRQLKSLLLHLHQVHLSQYINDVRKRLKPHNYVILGPVGSGKTHGVAFEVENRLKIDQPALLIRAKDCYILNWKNILSDGLQACSDWSDIQILGALCSLARNKSVNLAAEEKNNLLNNNIKFLICIDGIDESSEPQKWKDLINETRVWFGLFPDIRFVFTCRNYPVQNQNPFSLPTDDREICRKDIYAGDSQITFDYLKHFGIIYDKTPWIINSFENGLSLRLFCEEYKGKDLSKHFKNPVFNSSKKLLEDKIERLENEFLKRLKESITINERIVNRSLNHIIGYFLTENKIKKNVLRNFLYEELDQVIDKKEIGLLLDLLSDNGFLIYYSNYNEDGIIAEEFYETGIQSYSEFLLAKRIAKDIANNRILEISQTIIGEKYGYVRELVALALLSEHNILIGEDGFWINDFSEWEMLKLQFTVFSLVSKNIIEQYEPYLTQLFLKERDRFVQHFVLPNSNREDLNIIENIIHKTLLGFPNTYERDVFWSGPDDHEIENQSHLSSCFEYETMFYFSKFNQDPLLYAWALSTTSKPIREKIKNELTRWALNDIGEFVNLLEKLFFVCNDAQIQEDLAIIIYGLSSLVKVDTPKVHLLIDWIQNEIFHPGKIGALKNSVIRHSCRCFIEKAYKFNLCAKEIHDISIPPYTTSKNELLTFCTNGDILMDGLYPIQHDLYWNTIEEAYEGFVDYSGGNVNEEMSDLLMHHNRADISPKDFFTRVAIQFLKDLGWNKESGYADIGSKQFMTYEEKYTFLAVRYIQGYLADRLPYLKFSKKKKLDDYRQILHISNPAHEEAIKIEYLNNDTIKWFIPEDIAQIIISSSEKINDDIKHWTIKAPNYNFSKWLFPCNLNLLRKKGEVKDNWFVLDSYLALSDPSGIGRAWLDTSCLLLDDENFNNLKVLLSNDTITIKLDTDNFKAGINGHVYNSLTDVVWRDNINEYNKEITLINDSYQFVQAYPTVTEVSENSLTSGDAHHNIPSSTVRNILGINVTDKTAYFDKRDNLKVITHSAYDDTFNRQSLLLADKEYMENAMKTDNLNPVWICKEFRSTMDHLMIKENNAHWQNCRIWIVTKLKTKYKSFLVHNDYYTNN